MAENKGILLAKSVQKHAGRAKEKVSHDTDDHEERGILAPHRIPKSRSGV